MFLGRVPAHGEPLWTRHDRDVAIAWLTYRDSLHRCGVPRDIALAPENEFLPKDDADDMWRRRWEGEMAHCHVCAADDRARRLYEEAAKSSDVGEVNRDGLTVLIHDNAVPPPAVQPS